MDERSHRAVHQFLDANGIQVECEGQGDKFTISGQDLCRILEDYCTVKAEFEGLSRICEGYPLVQATLRAKALLDQFAGQMLRSRESHEMRPENQTGSGEQDPNRPRPFLVRGSGERN